MDAVLAEVFPDPTDRVPDGWFIKTVGEISRPPQYGYTESARKEPVGPQFLRITDIQDGKVDWSSVPYCECNDADHAKYQLANGDIVFARSGATTGKTFLVKNPPDAVFASYLIRLRVVNDATPDFVWWFFQSPYYWKQIVLRGGAQPNMNAQILKTIRVPIPADPSLQSQIIARLNGARNEITEMQAMSAADEKLFDDMEQSILAQAFREEL
jgi:type I restriction enzyme S subunit